MMIEGYYHQSRKLIFSPGKLGPTRKGDFVFRFPSLMIEHPRWGFVEGKPRLIDRIRGNVYDQDEFNRALRYG